MLIFLIYSNRPFFHNLESREAVIRILLLLPKKDFTPPKSLQIFCFKENRSFYKNSKKNFAFSSYLTLCSIDFRDSCTELNFIYYVLFAYTEKRYICI
jgi:hypothetical protein